MYEIIGIRRIDYKNKSGRHISGYEVNYTYDYSEGYGDGKACDSTFVNDDVFARSGITVGSPSMPVFDKRGRCTGFMESPM